MFTDSHCHLDFTEFDADRDELIKRCAQLNINRFIVPGITAKRWPRVLELCQKYQNAWPCLGLHPWWIAKATDNDLIVLDQMIRKNDIVAVGEIGIDGVIEDIDKQTEYFVKQLHIAKKYDLPIVVHHRKSHQLIVSELKKISLPKSGIIHAFSGSYQQAKAYIDLGFKLGIGGTITYPRAIKTIKTVKKLPLDSILLETDAPAMPLNGFQGEINSPEKITDVFQQLCSIRTESPEKVQQAIEQNLLQVFNLE
ncbi:TatD family hydrolase [Thalassotalea psychrophila]|uniref:TatD family hydrolase n=1 Tax=Thalassotalea psychrophila TaxID=3065647 RepID=A0ABY9TX72_9GAMM|nr:TatD family hydrolase [Colwelliaceae bacterium SQ149]